jgi:hypothetical protein
VFIMGFLNCAITLFTLDVFTTAGVLFPGCVMIADLLLAVMIVTQAGPRFRGERRPAVTMGAVS